MCCTTSIRCSPNLSARNSRSPHLSFVAYPPSWESCACPMPSCSAPIGGAMEFIPVVGPLVAGLAITVVARPHRLPALAHPDFVLLAWRMVQDYVISPRIMGASVELHPLAALFGVLAGGEIAGVLGVYLSIPVMASLAHRLASLAHLCRKTQIRPPQRIPPARNRPRQEKT
jgi:hypothetical protein